MRLIVNGEPREVGDEITVAELLATEDADRRGTAVAVEGDVVPRSEWATCRLAADAHVELVRAVQGG
jgi:sulfur carrier protein